jgi:hypothetical protein
MKLYLLLALSMTAFSCATTEKPVSENKLANLPKPAAELKLRYDLDKNGNVENIRVLNRDEVKSDWFIEKVVADLKKRKVTKLSDGTVPPVKDHNETVGYKEVD